MGKISPVSAKYIIHATIEIDGIVDKPDAIGAIFGQTEGLLGAELELRELQRSGRIGRIEVDMQAKSGKSSGKIVIPSSLDKAETSIIGAALEVIQRIGPCNARIKVNNIEDVRISRRNFVIERAKVLLRQLTQDVLPDSQELSDEVAHSVRVMEIQEYGNERLPAGPAVGDADEVILVEGRADVVNLLKHGIKNAIAMNGTNVPKTIVELSKKKVTTVFVDGDRGGDLIVKALIDVAELDYITRAPDGKELEEITQKEILKALRSRIAAEQYKLDISGSDIPKSEQKGNYKQNRDNNKSYSQKSYNNKYQNQQKPPQQQQTTKYKKIKPDKKQNEIFKNMLENLIGTRGAQILDQNFNILGKVPISELATTLNSLSGGVVAVVFDGEINKQIVKIAEKLDIKFLVGMDTQVKDSDTKVSLLTADML